MLVFVIRDLLTCCKELKASILGVRIWNRCRPLAVLAIFLVQMSSYMIFFGLGYMLCCVIVPCGRASCCFLLLRRHRHLALDKR